MNDFEKEVRKNIAELAEDTDLANLTDRWIRESAKYKYSYNFSWLGRPIIQYPQDILVLQEIVWKVKPDLIIETGVAHGGSVIFYASMLELLGSNGKVIGIDIEIRKHHRAAIEAHPMFRRVELIEGSSTDRDIINRIAREADQADAVMIVLDSNHTHDHVLKELALYSPFVTKGSYLVVLDTIVEDLPDDFFPERPWGKGNNPKTAVWEFLESTNRFEIDKELESKLLITVAPDGFLKCLSD
jgi:cephalosporin hydroxylase